MQTCKETSRTLREIEAHYSDLSAEWDISADKQELIKDIEERILTQEHVYVDSALCLGLGTLETTCIHYSDFDFGVKEEEDEAFDGYSMCMRDTRRTLRQLLVLETLLKCLQSKCTISRPRFQDPRFSTSDVKFLERRGHVVIPYNFEQVLARRAGLATRQSNSLWGLDPALSPLMSSATLIFAPALDYDVQFELVYTCKPSLYLGSNLVECVTDTNPFMSGYFPANDFDEFVTTYEDALLVRGSIEENVLIGNALGLMWPAETGDVRAVWRMQKRRLEVEVAREDRLDRSDSDSSY